MLLKESSITVSLRKSIWSEMEYIYAIASPASIPFSVKYRCSIQNLNPQSMTQSILIRKKLEKICKPARSYCSKINWTRINFWKRGTFYYLSFVSVINYKILGYCAMRLQWPVDNTSDASKYPRASCNTRAKPISLYTEFRKVYLALRSR